MSVEIRHPAFESVVGPSVEFEKLGTGFLFTEGPLWNADRASICCSATCRGTGSAAGRPRRCRRVQEPEQQVERPDLGREGRLLACEHATSRVTRTEPDGRITVLASSLRRQGAEQS